MRFTLALALISGLAGLVSDLAAPSPAAAADGDSVARARRHAVTIPRRAAPRIVAGKRIGGYSYSWYDTIGVGGSAGRYARDPSLTTQTIAGPFDSGFFFNSSRGLHGGDAPYWN